MCHLHKFHFYLQWRKQAKKIESDGYIKRYSQQQHLQTFYHGNLSPNLVLYDEWNRISEKYVRYANNCYETDNNWFHLIKMQIVPCSVFLFQLVLSSKGWGRRSAVLSKTD